VIDVSNDRRVTEIVADGASAERSGDAVGSAVNDLRGMRRRDRKLGHACYPMSARVSSFERLSSSNRTPHASNNLSVSTWDLSRQEP
jgi:hypothetical protein